MTVGSALQTKGCLKANNNNPPPRGATRGAPKEVKTIGLKDFHESNPPALGTKGQHKEELKTEQPHQEHVQHEVRLTKSEAKKDREALDRHVARNGFAGHAKEKKHHIVQEELLAADARANDILDEMHEADKRHADGPDADTSHKMAYAEYQKHVQKRGDAVAHMNKSHSARKVEAPALKEMQRDSPHEDYMHVATRRNDFNNDCLYDSINTDKAPVAPDAAAARTASAS